jgi:hypothetical protein
MIVVLLADTGERYITTTLFSGDAGPRSDDAAQQRLAADAPKAARR